MTEPIILNSTFDAAPAKVWEALTDESKMRQWYFPMMDAFEPRVGFETEFTVHHNGNNYIHQWKVVAVESQKRLDCEWRYGGFDGKAILSFLISPEADRTALTLKFTFAEPFDADNYPDLSRENFVAGWKHFMEALANFLKR